MSTLNSPVVVKEFPAGTAEEQFTFSITGTKDDGTAFTDSVSSDQNSVAYTFVPGTYTVTCTKNGETSLPSDPVTVTQPQTVSFNVPDATGKVTVTL